jgi:hypothetical protein
VTFPPAIVRWLRIDFDTPAVAQVDPIPIPDPDAEVPLHVAVIFPPVILMIPILDVDSP